MSAAATRAGGDGSHGHPGSRREWPLMRTYADAIIEVERLTGAKGRQSIEPGDPPLDGVMLFDTKPNDGLELVEQHQFRLRQAGAYLFLYEHEFGNGPDIVGLAATTDQ